MKKKILSVFAFFPLPTLILFCGYVPNWIGAERNTVQNLAWWLVLLFVPVALLQAISISAWLTLNKLAGAEGKSKSWVERLFVGGGSASVLVVVLYLGFFYFGNRSPEKSAETKQQETLWTQSQMNQIFSSGDEKAFAQAIPHFRPIQAFTRTRLEWNLSHSLSKGQIGFLKVWASDLSNEVPPGEWASRALYLISKNPELDIKYFEDVLGILRSKQWDLDLPFSIGGPEKLPLREHFERALPENPKLKAYSTLLAKSANK